MVRVGFGWAEHLRLRPHLRLRLRPHLRLRLRPHLRLRLRRAQPRLERCSGGRAAGQLRVTPAAGGASEGYHTASTASLYHTASTASLYHTASAASLALGSGGWLGLELLGRLIASAPSVRGEGGGGGGREGEGIASSSWAPVRSALAQRRAPRRAATKRAAAGARPRARWRRAATACAATPHARAALRNAL